MATRQNKAGSMHRRMLDAGVYELDEFDAWMQARGWAWQGLENGVYGVSIADAMVLYTVEDPVRFCETFMKRNDGSPYRFFDYQRESIRTWRQDTVTSSAAEVGKTLELTALLLWGHITGFGFQIKAPTSLVAAPQQIFLNEIIDAIERQIGVFKAMEGESILKDAWIEPRRTPHTQLRLRSWVAGGKPALATIDFRPAGHDGSAFRGVHSTALVMVDEAAKMKAQVQWTELYRARMPGCKSRFYSVPDGDRSTEFYRLSQAAVLGLPEGQPGFRKFHWPKTLMPPPFWSEERDREFVRLYGGRNTPGYQRNVMGEWGDAENPVWPWAQLLPNIVDLPDFRIIKLIADTEADVLSIEVMACTMSIHDGRKTGNYTWLQDGAIPLQPLLRGGDDQRRQAMLDILRPHLTPQSMGVFYAGADLGERADPTAIYLSEQVGQTLIDRVRVHAQGFPYHLQEELVAALDGIYGRLPMWGVDMGSAGTTVVKDLINVDRFAQCHFEDRLVGFHFQQNVDCMGEDGELLEQEDPQTGATHVAVAPAKHWASQCISARLQAGGYAMAYDTDALNDMVTQTAREGARFPIYSKQRDHIPDARRQQMLIRLHALRAEGSGHDLFVSGTSERHAA